jgi:bacterioferritin-associated ferredoxin
MIICSCNVLSDHDVRAAVHADDEPRRTVSEVYTCLGCSPECGRCARTIRRIITDALGVCAGGCVEGCAHQKSQAFPELEVFPELLEESVDA